MRTATLIMCRVPAPTYMFASPLPPALLGVRPGSVESPPPAFALPNHGAAPSLTLSISLPLLLLCPDKKKIGLKPALQ